MKIIESGVFRREHRGNICDRALFRFRHFCPSFACAQSAQMIATL
jgi:hypothetical protein